MRRLIEEKPWIGWAVAGLLMLVGAFLVARPLLSGSGGPQALADHVIIIYEDTGEEGKVGFGSLQRILLQEAARQPLNPAEGLTNPKTGKKTGFPKDRDMWQKLVTNANEAMKKKPS